MTITIGDFIKALDSRLVDRDAKSMISVLIDFYESPYETPKDPDPVDYYEPTNQKKELVIDYIKLLNEVISHVDLTVKKLNIPYVDERNIKSYLINQSECKSDAKDFFPFPLYISVNQDQMDTIGVLIDYDGRVMEIHEGNDEATSETINFVNKLVNPKGKQVRIYAAHTANLIYKIEQFDIIPEGLYVSPYRPHAESYIDLNGDRLLFTGVIDINDVSQESDLDWKTLRSTKIDKFRIL